MYIDKYDMNNTIHENGSISGLFSIEVIGGKPSGLFLDRDFCVLMGYDPTTPPVQLMHEMFSEVHEDDKNNILNVIASCTAGVMMELQFRWKHPLLGWTNVSCTGIHSDGDDDHYFARGYFKGNYGEEQISRNEYDALLLQNLLADAMMDSFVVCGLTDLENNHIYLLKDVFNTGGVLGSGFTYEQWRDAISGLIDRESVERFDEVSSRNAMLHYFANEDEERQDEFRILNPKTRKYRWIKLRFVKFKHALASKYKEFFVFRDITDHQHTNFKEALRMQLINGLAVPYDDIDFINLKTGVLYSSEAGEGKYAEDFAERGLFDHEVIRYIQNCDLTQEESMRIYDMYNCKSMLEQFSRGVPRIETELRRMNRLKNRYEWVRIQGFVASRDEYGDPHMAIITIQSIDQEKERQMRDKQALEMALRAEQQYRQAILSNAIAVYTFNVTTDTMYDEVIEQDGIDALVPQMGLSCPCSYNEYISRKARLLTSEQEAEIFRRDFSTEHLLEMFENNRFSADIEYEFLNGANKGIFRESVILTKDLNTDEIWGISYVTNVTYEREESRRIEQALRDSFFQAQRANSAKTLFMSQMSHDIRTPLNSILGMAQIAQEHIDDRERLIDCMNKIEYSGRHLLELINNVLDLSAIESGKTVLATDDFDMRHLFDEVLKVVKPLAEKKDHKLITELQPMHNAVNGDQVKLKRLLTNVLSNAVKYTPDGGEIRFSAEELEPDRHDVARYMFTVRDNGMGMSEEFVSRLFDPFVRADDSRTTKVEGTGLGMTIALNIARMMNGNINVRSKIGEGSVFEITVCLKRGEEHAADIYSELSMDEPRKEKLSDYDFGGRRVLLAEDLDFNAEIAVEFLAQANIVTERACNGAEAVRMFAASPAGYYGMIFMDIQMPELDGHTAARKIRASAKEDAQSIPIIAMTANAFVDDVKKSKDSGMNGHIAKPIETARLLSELKRWLGGMKKTDTTAKE